MIREIIQIGDKKLSEICEPIKVGTISTGEIQDLAADLVETLKFHKNEAAGLAASQIGELKRIFAVRRYDLEGRQIPSKEVDPRIDIMINPTIEILNKSKNYEWEGCLSIGKGSERLFGPVGRARKIRVTYLDLNGQKQEIEASGFFSNLVQHENDHLEGLLFLRYINNPQNIWRESVLDRYLHEVGSFPPIKD